MQRRHAENVCALGSKGNIVMVVDGGHNSLLEIPVNQHVVVGFLKLQKKEKKIYSNRSRIHSNARLFAVPLVFSDPDNFHAKDKIVSITKAEFDYDRILVLATVYNNWNIWR